ncbi:MAG TPA: response regulator [Sphingomicrobium sp.]|nr:response regulator [Sphingomicrobium sp.]
MKETEGSAARRDVPRVLIVEPSRNYLGVLARRVSEGGFRVATADSAAGAFAELYRQPADLVLAELRMRGTSGVELVRILREDPVHRDVPIFLITGRSDASGAVEAYRCGADTVIAKPFHFEVLVARIGREIERARAVKELREDKAALDARIVGRAIELGEMRERWLASEAERQRLEQLVGKAGS